MSKLSMSISPGDRAGRNHNLEFEYRQQLDNIDPTRTFLNETLKDENVRDVYQELFGSALEKYNEKKRQAARPNEQILDYYEHVKNGKQEQESYELVIQFGDKDTFSATDEKNRKLAKGALENFYSEFERTFPNFRIYQAAIHLDEATPHLHIAYVPYFENYGAKRGLEVRTAHGKAIKQMGYSDIYDLNKRMFGILESVGMEAGIEREIKNCNRSHMNVRDYKAHAEEIRAAEAYPYNNDPKMVNALEYMADKQAKQLELIQQYQALAEHVQNASHFEFKDLKDEAEQVIQAQHRLFPEWPKVKAKMQQVAETIKSLPEKFWTSILHPVSKTLREEALNIEKDGQEDLDSAVRASVRASKQVNHSEPTTTHKEWEMGM